jgi:AcrR family transcriptional regulator
MKVPKAESAPLAELLLSMMPEGVDAADDGTDSPTVKQRKKEILDASLRVFSRKGFDGSRTREIAREAGISEATVFKYFPTKRHLMLGLVRPMVEMIGRPLFMKPVEAILERQMGRPLEETLSLIMVDRWRLFMKHERFLVLVFSEANRNPEMVETVKQIVVPQILDYLEPLFAAAAASGEIRSDLSVRFMTRAFLFQVLGYIFSTYVGPEYFALGEPEADIPGVVALFVRGLRPLKGEDQ